MSNKNFLGKGMKFPPQINPTTGRFACVSEEESIKESIYLILMTQKGERFMRPEFGSNSNNYIFAQTDNTMLSLMAYEIQNDIAKNEPRVENVRVTLDTQSSQGCLFIYIDYTVCGKNTHENMVFPFYLGEEPNEEGAIYETMEDYLI